MTRIYTDTEGIDIDINNVADIQKALLFKSEHIKAKADPEIFAKAAEYLEKSIPMKPIHHKTYGWISDTYGCPICREKLEVGYGCKKCLQAIDWSDK